MLTETCSERWTYRQPVEIRFGAGILGRLAEAVSDLGGTHGLLVTSRSFAGLADTLRQDTGNRIREVYSAVRPNPELRFVNDCAALIRAERLDFVVALGGGSVLDCAKAAAAVAGTKRDIRYYFGTGNALPERGIPVIAVPTTAGTGSEVTSVSVLSDGEKKVPLASPSLTAKIALIDPELTQSLPPYTTACTGMDALCHAIEGYSSIHHQPICDTLAVRAAGLVLSYLETAVRDGGNAEAREAMAQASLLAGLSFALPKTTGPHACSYPLTAQYKIPHGEACGLTLDWFLKVNAGVPRIQLLAQQLGFGEVKLLAEQIAALRSRIGLRSDLRDLKLTESQVHKLAKDSLHPNLYNNPVPVTEDMLDRMYSELAGLPPR